MTGVGKLGLVILLLALCAPAAARLSKHSGTGRAFRLPEWLMNVCHHPAGSRGTQRRYRQHPTELLNAVVEQESRGDSQCIVSRPQPAVAKAVVNSERSFLLISVVPASLITDPAFRCTFLI